MAIRHCSSSCNGSAATPHRLTTEHALFFLYGTGANGKIGIPEHHRRHPRRLPQDGADRDLHRLQHGATPDRPRRAARRPPCHRRRDRGRPPLGGKQDQGAHRRRPDRGPVHAAGLLRIHPAVQAGHRRQPQARPALRRRGDPAPVSPDPLHRHDPARGARPRTCRRSSSTNGPAFSPGWSMAASNGKSTVSLRLRQ